MPISMVSSFSVIFISLTLVCHSHFTILYNQHICGAMCALENLANSFQRNQVIVLLCQSSTPACHISLALIVQ